jgi:ABC-type Zn uptake system ZnuABC Zn-binding protein ZnuA
MRRARGRAGAKGTAGAGPRAIAVAAVATAALVLTACGDSGSGPDANGKLRVVATTTQVGDLVRHVAKDRAEVTQMLQPGSDPHEYEPRPSDALAVAKASLVFRSGGEVDDWLGGVVDQAGGDAREIALLDHVRRLKDDPHWWQDASNAHRAVAAIRDALVEADPENARTYRLNARAYQEGLQQLDAAVAACADQLPEGRRKLVTSHDSLGYYARRYRFEVVGAAIPSLSTQAQPSAAATQRLVDQIERQRVPAIFPESALNPKLERAIAREAGAKVAPPLWADALGPKGSPAATYDGALKANTRTIVDALGEGRVRCELPR